jgi:hypothetical protein
VRKPVDFRQSLSRLALVGGVFYVRPESARSMAAISGLVVEEVAEPAPQAPEQEVVVEQVFPTETTLAPSGQVDRVERSWIPATQGANQPESTNEGTYFEGEWADSQPVYGVEFGTGRAVRLHDVMEGVQMRARPQ